MRLKQLYNLQDLNQEIEQGYVSDREWNGYGILNYTPKAQYERRWNHITRTCRGLIYTQKDLIIAARPYPKFFNLGEPETGDLPLDTEVVVTEKLDGSLGIGYLHDGQPRIATRGSLQSEQALHATKRLQTRYDGWEPPQGITPLFEIIYPGNRIVVDYGNLDDLVLLGGIDIRTGKHVPADRIDWDGPRVQTHAHRTIRDALEDQQRQNVEGFVLQLADTEQRIKIKQSDYVELHRIVTGWNQRTIWEQLAAGKNLATLVADLPDEFHKWATETAEQLTTEHQELIKSAETAYREIRNQLPHHIERKDFAQAAAKHPLRPALFMLHDNRDLTDWAWKQVRPKREEPKID